MSEPVDDASVQAAVKAIAAYGGPDVLINNVGIEEGGDNNVAIGPTDVTAEVARQTFETNVVGTVHVTHDSPPPSGEPGTFHESCGAACMSSRSTRRR